MKTINNLIRKHTALNGILDLVKCAKRDGYRPTLYCTKARRKKWREELTAIADFYDATMQRAGLKQRAYRI